MQALVDSANNSLAIIQQKMLNLENELKSPMNTDETESNQTGANNEQNNQANTISEGTEDNSTHNRN